MRRCLPCVLVPMLLAPFACSRAGLELGDTQRDQAIFGGEPASASHHDAVVSLHPRSGNQVSRGSFCTGTLVTPEVVLTAAHCVENNANPARVAVYFGNNAFQDSAPRFVGVSEVVIHPSYSPVPNHDVAYLRLATPVLDVAPVPPLPSTLALTPGDVGQLGLEFVGFGRTEQGGFNTKLRVEGVLGGLGCSVPGCFNGGAQLAQTQFSYRQRLSDGGGGPCNGDSGGPAFVLRGGTRYVAGVTSYGDPDCTLFGVSARVDTQSAFLANALEGAPADGVEDLEAPTVSLVAPAAGAVLPANSAIEVVATASDDVGLSVVELEWDHTDERFSCPTSAAGLSCQVSGDTYTWTLQVSTGSRTFRVVARDFAGNEAATPVATIQLGEDAVTAPPPSQADDVPPSVSLLSPTDGETLVQNSQIEVVASVSDDVGLQEVLLLWDFTSEEISCPVQRQGVTCEVSGSTYTWRLNVGTGERIFRVRARDLAGNLAETPARAISLGAVAAPPEDPAEPPPGVPSPAEPPLEGPAPGEPAPPEPTSPPTSQPAAPVAGFEDAPRLACGERATAMLAPGEAQWFRTDATEGVSVEVRVDVEGEAPVSVAVTRPDGLVLAEEPAGGDQAVSFEVEPDLGVLVTSDSAANYEITLLCPETDVSPAVEGGCAQASPSTSALGGGLAFLLLFARRRGRRRSAPRGASASRDV